ncbi:hypothetical protein C8R45DRAFT_82300 [Mycena sanguinolenta]|nr:hypothetical protein C8R45DRAFT_82300 [Mycena sanguinolenta]
MVFVPKSSRSSLCERSMLRGSCLGRFTALQVTNTVLAGSAGRYTTVSSTTVFQPALTLRTNKHFHAVIGRVVDVFRLLSNPPVSGCYTPADCPSLRLAAMDHIQDLFRLNAGSPLELWDSEQWDGSRICFTCGRDFRRKHDVNRQAFWDKLPGLYGLPPWEELERLKNAAIGTNIFC